MCCTFQTCFFILPATIIYHHRRTFPKRTPGLPATCISRSYFTSVRAPYCCPLLAYSIIIFFTIGVLFSLLNFIFTKYTPLLSAVVFSS